MKRPLHERLLTVYKTLLAEELVRQEMDHREDVTQELHDAIENYANENESFREAAQAISDEFEDAKNKMKEKAIVSAFLRKFNIWVLLANIP